MGAVAAAAIIRREKEIVDRFRSMGASSPETARSEIQLGTEHGVAWRRLIDHAVVRSTPAGLFYLDEPSWRALQRLRHRLALVFGLIAIFLAVGAFLAGRIGAGH